MEEVRELVEEEGGLAMVTVFPSLVGVSPRTSLSAMSVRVERGEATVLRTNIRSGNGTGEYEIWEWY